MRIAQIVCVYPPYAGGIGASAAKLTEYLSQQGHEVTVFTAKRGYTFEDNRVQALNAWPRIGHGALLPQLLWRLRNFDLIYLHYPYFGAAEITWLSTIINKKQKLIIHYHMDTAGLSWTTKPFASLAKIMLKPLFHRSNAIVGASTDYLQNSAAAKFIGANNDKIKEIPFTVDTKIFYPLKDKNLSPERERQILFVGGLDRAHYFKGVDVLLKAAEKLNFKNWKINIIGTGDLQKQYETLANKLKIADKINFLGNVNETDKAEYFRHADLFILPSINSHEAFGIVLLEALASGTPVIASNLPGVRKVFEAGVQGLLSEANNIEDLKTAIENILRDDKRRTEMAIAARKLAEEKYSPEVWGLKIDELINKLN